MKWINAETNKPPIDVADELNKAAEMSERVIVYCDGRYTKGYWFGRYHHGKNREFWNIEGISGLDQESVTHFAVLHPPTNF